MDFGCIKEDSKDLAFERKILFSLENEVILKVNVV